VTIPPGLGNAARKVSDMVREMIPRFRHQLTAEEAALGLHLRGNAALLEALKALIKTRIQGRASIPTPIDPVVCRGMMERDRELQWLLSRLEYIHASTVSQLGEEEREQPA